MATKKKKTTKKKKSRIGKSGLNANNPLIPIVTGVIGLLVSPKANAWVDDTLLKGKVDGKIIGGSELTIGAGLLFIKFGKKKYIAQVATGGFAAGMGIRKLLLEFGVLNGVAGYKAAPVIARRPAAVRRMGSYGNVPVIGLTPGYMTKG